MLHYLFLYAMFVYGAACMHFAFKSNHTLKTFFFVIVFMPILGPLWLGLAVIERVYNWIECEW